MSLFSVITPTKELSIGIWEITESIDELLEITSLSEEEKNILDKFSSINRKQQWLATRTLIQRILDTQTRIGYRESGKPYLLGNNFEFSISHSEKFACVLLDKNKPCGIDIEKISPKLDKVKHKFLNSSEYELIKEGNLLQKLCVIWGVKESLYKMDGSNNLNFSNDITILSKIDLEEGQLDAVINKNGQNKPYTLQYYKIKDCMLVITL